MPPAAAPGLVLALLHRQDRYLALRTCSTRRRELGARTRTLVLSEEGREGEAPLLPTVDLASSFPALRTLVLRCTYKDGWAERFAAFVTRNRVALQQLQHVDLAYDEDDNYAAPTLSSGALAALALLPALQSLYTRVDERLDPLSWAALASLTQLTGLHLSLDGASYEQHLQQIVEAAPLLQELWVDGHGALPGQMACLTGLRSLSSLHLDVTLDDAQALRAFTALRSLTHLGLRLDSMEPLDALLAAVAQLSGLASLSLDRTELDVVVTVLPLVTLQKLTSLVLDRYVTLGHDDALALASLAQLRRLHALFGSPAAAATAGLARLEECKVGMYHTDQDQEELGELVSLSGRVELDFLEGFDLSRVHTLSLINICRYEAGRDEELCLHLPNCLHLHALSIDGSDAVLLQAAVLQAVAALPQLQHLRLQLFGYTDPFSKLDFSGIAALMAGCRQLKQLNLVAMTGLQEGTVGALMQMPRLRLLRLLDCSPGLSQERCQALAGQLRLYELQVDVVVDDGSGRAEWMMSKLGGRGGRGALGERWREA
jgi:hypothetical protein